METVYKEFSNNRWNYWTYSDGYRVAMSKTQYEKMLRQGAKSVLIK